MAALKIDVDLVRSLVSGQFPNWAALPIRPVAVQGWDNRNFRLGEKMLVRLPSSEAYSPQVLKEHKWLPRLASKLPLAIPKPLALGSPGADYPLRWSVYEWIEGDPASHARIGDRFEIGLGVAQFLRALHQIDIQDGPPPGAHNFYRGNSLAVYDGEARTAISALAQTLDENAALAAWEAGARSSWGHPPLWVHGDLSAGNLLVKAGRLAAVIDFGLLAIGDPACDLVIAWTLLDKRGREAFRSALDVDSDTWSRGRAWALWKAAIVAAGMTKTNVVEISQARGTLTAVLGDG